MKKYVGSHKDWMKQMDGWVDGGLAHVPVITLFDHALVSLLCMG